MKERQLLDFEACLESSNQAFEYNESSLKVLESKKVLNTVMEILNFYHHYYSLYGEKIPILCSTVEL